MSHKILTSKHWKSFISTRVQQMKSSGIREFFDIVTTSPDCISLGVGEPDFETPFPVSQAGINAIKNGITHYTSNKGDPTLRDSLQQYYQQNYHVDYTAEQQILITTGVSQALDLAIRSICDPEDIILYIEPCYVSYEPMITLAGGIPHKITVSQEQYFKLTPELLDRTIRSLPEKQCKAIILNYPSNPTGASFSKQELTALSKVILQYNLLVISDEIYGELSFDQPHICAGSIQELQERTLVLGGFSKGFAMTGWRVGYACGPSTWIEAITKIHQYSMLCASSIAQQAAITALSPKEGIPFKDQMLKDYKERREFLVKELNHLNLTTILPEGAFYTYSNISSTRMSSLDFATKLLKEENIAVVPGTAFDLINGHLFIRCSFATNLDEIKTAIFRIKSFLQRIKSQ